MSKKFAFVLIFAALFLSSCGGNNTTQEVSEAAQTTNTAQPRPTSTKSPTSTPRPQPTNTPAPLCKPGETILDAVGDVEVDYLDIVKVRSELQGETLEVWIYLKDLPELIAINRDGLEDGNLEYQWRAGIDVDNDPNDTPDIPVDGAEFFIDTGHFCFYENRSHQAPEVQLPQHFSRTVSKVTEENTIKGHAHLLDLQVNLEENYIYMKGDVPGINADSRIYFYTYENVPGEIRVIEDFVCSVSNP